MVFHDRGKTIDEEIKKLEDRLFYSGHPGHVLHTAPLIRQEKVYKGVSLQERRKLFMTFFTFFNKLDVKYRVFIVPRSPKTDELSLINLLSRQIRAFLNENGDFFKVNKFTVYYDNGQKNVSRILAAMFGEKNFEFKIIRPVDYRLFQIADLVTTMEMINYKREKTENSVSEKIFFKTMNEFNRSYYKRIVRKRF